MPGPVTGERHRISLRVRGKALQAASLLVIPAWSPDLLTGEGKLKVRKHILTCLFREGAIQLNARGTKRLYSPLRALTHR